MKQNKIRKKTLHSAMRAGLAAAAGGRRRKMLFALGVVLLAAAGAGLYVGYAKLRGVYEEQFLLEDLEKQVTIKVPEPEVFGQKPPISKGTVIDLFGLKKGVNLAAVDFAEKRARILAERHFIKDIRLHIQPTSRPAQSGDPDARRHENFVHLTIETEVRRPAAVLSCRNDTRNQRLVDESDGMVFEKVTQLRLPRILERENARTPPGAHLAGRSLAALRLVTHWQQTASAANGEIRIEQVDATSPDYLLVYLDNGHRAKFAWEGMDEQLPGSQKAMERQVKHLREALRTNLATSTFVTSIMWNATLPKSVFADLKEPIQ